MDLFSDTVLGLRFIVHDHPEWGVSILAPILANTLLTSFLWARKEKGPDRRWTWILVLLQVSYQLTFEML